MKKLLPFLFVSLFFAQQNKAQITINTADLPSTNVNYIRDNAGNTAVIDLNITGASQTWDYTQLTVTSTDTITYQTVGSTNFAYQLYFNNPFSQNWLSDLAQPGADFPSIPLIPITVTNVINYFKKSSSGYYQTGMGATVSGLPASIKYDPRDKVLPIPCNYGINESNAFSSLISVPAVGAWAQNKIRANEVDGWGTLKLPYADYNTLRIKSTVSGTDSFYVDQFGFGIAVPSTQIQYKWYANGEGEPVLTVNATDLAGTPQITNANYKHTDAPSSGIAEKSILNTPLDLYPNPATNNISIKYFTPIPDKASLEIIDITGKQVISEIVNCIANSNNTFSIDISNLSKGFYQIALKQSGSIASAKLVID